MRQVCYRAGMDQRVKLEEWRDCDRDEISIAAQGGLQRRIASRCTGRLCLSQMAISQDVAAEARLALIG